jgi:hypothetical protein
VFKSQLLGAPQLGEEVVVVRMEMATGGHYSEKGGVEQRLELDGEGGGTPALLWMVGRRHSSVTREVSDGGEERGPLVGEERWHR